MLILFRTLISLVCVCVRKLSKTEQYLINEATYRKFNFLGGEQSSSQLKTKEIGLDGKNGENPMRKSLHYFDLYNNNVKGSL